MDSYIWTRVTASIFRADNHDANGTFVSVKLYLIRYIYLFKDYIRSVSKFRILPCTVSQLSGKKKKMIILYFNSAT